MPAASCATSRSSASWRASIRVSFRGSCWRPRRRHSSSDGSCPSSRRCRSSIPISSSSSASTTIVSTSSPPESTVPCASASCPGRLPDRTLRLRLLRRAGAPRARGHAVGAARSRSSAVHPEFRLVTTRALTLPRSGGRAVHGQGARHARIDNGETLRAAALAGAGVIYAPRDLVADGLTTGAPVDVLPGWRTIELPIRTVHPSRTMVPRRVSAVIDALAGGSREDA